MIIRAFDENSGFIVVDSLDDIYKVAKIMLDKDINDYSLEEEDGLTTLTLQAANGEIIKFAVFDEESFSDLAYGAKEYEEYAPELAPKNLLDTAKTQGFVYTTSNPKLDDFFTLSERYPVLEVTPEGKYILKTDVEGKNVAIREDMLQKYFEEASTSELDRFEAIKKRKEEQALSGTEETEEETEDAM